VAGHAALPVEFCGSYQRGFHNRGRCAVKLQQRDGVSCGRRPGREAVVERQAVGPDRIREVACRVLVTQQFDELGIVRGGQDDVLPAMARIPEEFP